MKSYSLDQWLALHSFSRPFWYKLVGRGEAPRSFRVGRCVRITEEANTEWLKTREAEAIAA
jgi:predicted DNA-binding transcriptional regulator AlpA